MSFRLLEMMGYFFSYEKKKKKEKYSTLQLGAVFVSPNKGLSVNFPQFQSPTAQPEWKHNVIAIAEIN